MTDIGTTRGAIAKAVAPLLIVNGVTVYGQLAYAMEDVSPAVWPLWACVALAVGFAMAVESVALYIQWHAHDALLLKSHATARSLRRASYVVALFVAAMNYSHFTESLGEPTAAGVAFGMLSLLSPWLWGLHSRRQARIQLLKERRADDAGAEFSSMRARMFPIRTWKAKRHSVDWNITDPIEAWNAYHGRVDVDASPAPDVVDASPVLTSVPSIPAQRTRGASSRAASWDVEKAVEMILADASTEDIMAATSVGAKPLQLARRAVRFLQDGMDVDAAAARVPCSLAHVRRIKAAMEVAA